MELQAALQIPVGLGLPLIPQRIGTTIWDGTIRLWEKISAQHGFEPCRYAVVDLIRYLNCLIANDLLGNASIAQQAVEVRRICVLRGVPYPPVWGAAPQFEVPFDTRAHRFVVSNDGRTITDTLTGSCRRVQVIIAVNIGEEDSSDDEA